MATLSSGNTLSLNSLGTATAQATKSLSAAKGNTTGPIAISSFAIDSITGISGFTYGVENTSENYTVTFGGAGTNFTRVSSNADNYTWARTAGTTINATISKSSGAGVVSFLDNGVNASQTVRNTVASNTIGVTYADGFNDHIGGNYGVQLTKTIYCVDSYDGNSAALCLTADSPILLSDGTIVEAGDLEEGDVLKGYAFNGLSEDSDSNFLDWSTSTLGEVGKDVTITNLTYSFASRYYDVNNGEITGTADHPMLVKDSTDGLYRFKELHNLVIGDKLLKQNGSSLDEIEVTSVTSSDSTVEIVSIDVEQQDTYLVNGYVTHNKGGNTFTDFAGPAAPTVTYSNPAGAQNSTVNWAAAGGTTPTDYDVQIDNNSDFSSPDGTHSKSYSGTNVNVSGLSTGTWYARVRARDMGVYGPWSSTLTFSHTFEN
jgi:hypothetical protein